MGRIRELVRRVGEANAVLAVSMSASPVQRKSRRFMKQHPFTIVCIMRAERVQDLDQGAPSRDHHQWSIAPPCRHGEI